MKRIYRCAMDDALKALEERNFDEAVEKSLDMIRWGDVPTERLAGMAISLAAGLKSEETIKNILRFAKTEEPA